MLLPSWNRKSEPPRLRLPPVENEEYQVCLQACLVVDPRALLLDADIRDKRVANSSTATCTRLYLVGDQPPDPPGVSRDTADLSNVECRML